MSLKLAYAATEKRVPVLYAKGFDSAMTHANLTIRGKKTYFDAQKAIDAFFHMFIDKTFSLLFCFL